MGHRSVPTFSARGTEGDGVPAIDTIYARRVERARRAFFFWTDKLQCKEEVTQNTKPRWRGRAGFRT